MIENNIYLRLIRHRISTKMTVVRFFNTKFYTVFKRYCLTEYCCCNNHVVSDKVLMLFHYKKHDLALPFVSITSL